MHNLFQRSPPTLFRRGRQLLRLFRISKRQRDPQMPFGWETQNLARLFTFIDRRRDRTDSQFPGGELHVGCSLSPIEPAPGTRLDQEEHAQAGGPQVAGVAWRQVAQRIDQDLRRQGRVEVD